MNKIFNCTAINLGTIALLLLLLSVSCSGTRPGYQLPESHPPIFEMAERRVYCVRCHGHEKEPLDFARYNHTPTFTDSHRLVAYQDEKLCGICHAQSFCNDCHVTPSSELKPSIKYQTENYKRLQHRGDYIGRHRIDGRIDPSSCFRCHGNPRSAATCRRCHG